MSSKPPVISDALIDPAVMVPMFAEIAARLVTAILSADIAPAAIFVDVTAFAAMLPASIAFAATFNAVTAPACIAAASTELAAIC